MVKGIFEFLYRMREGYQHILNYSIYWLQQAEQDKKLYHLGKLQMEIDRRRKMFMVVFSGSCLPSIVVDIALLSILSFSMMVKMFYFKLHGIKSPSRS